MDGLKLLAEARQAGLTLRAEGERLLVRGPRHLEALAKRLLAHKAEVLPALEDERFICSGIERDLGLPPGSLTLWEPWRINSWMQPKHRPSPAGIAPPLASPGVQSSGPRATTKRGPCC